MAHPRMTDSSHSSLSLPDVLFSPLDSLVDALNASSTHPAPPPPLSPSALLSSSLPRHFHRRALFAQSRTRQKIQRGLDDLHPALDTALGTERQRVSEPITTHTRRTQPHPRPPPQTL